MTEKTQSKEIIDITSTAVDKIYGLMESRDRGALAVRVVLRGRMPGGGFQSEFKFVAEDDFSETDTVQDAGKFKMIFDNECAVSIDGALVDFDEEKYPAGFHIQYPDQIADNPGAVKKDWTDPVSIAVQNTIDAEINPGVAAHAGWVDLLDVQEGTAYIEMGGGCQGCGLSDVTMKQGIERLIIERVPEISAVIDATEHAEGNNPYYAPAKGGDEDGSAEPESPIAN